jgi:PilX N-terminal
MTNSSSGAALVIALMAMLLLLALGLMLVLNTAAETLIAGHFRRGVEAFYAADAGLERAMDDLARATDWSDVLGGLEHSAFVDGSCSGARALSDGSAIDLTNATNLLNCGHAGACTPAEMDASTAARPWGANNPRWRVYACGPLSAMTDAGTINSNLYVAVWTGNDPANPGNERLNVHAEAFGPGGAHRVLEATVARREDGGVRLVAWRELR